MSEHIQTINPATGERIRTYPITTPEGLNQGIEESAKAQGIWKTWSIEERSSVIIQLKQLLEQGKEEFAQLMAVEMGKPITQGRSEIEKCQWLIGYYAEKGEAFLADQIVETEAEKSVVSYKPLGVVLSIMPWNYPFWQVLRFAIPALLAGNAVLLKHADNVTGCAMALTELFRNISVPRGLFEMAILPNDRVKEAITHPLVQAVTLTGSTRAGRAVAGQAGASLKKTVLELGGSDPSIVLGDADLYEAAQSIALSRLLNNGQSCIAAKRVIVVDEVYNEFLELFKTEFQQAVVGDPLKEQTSIGPMARVDLRDELHRQVSESVQQGATLVFGGKKPHGKGAFYPVTLLTDVKKNMPAYSEELFGPVASVIKVRNEQEAIAVANDTDYGLGASIYTANIERAQQLASENIEAGSVFINGFVKSDPRLPFGGIKHSGYGRELGIFGIREFVNIKTIVTK
ncbi:MAG: NAD-dependent succinate-semialdehyde dehydrogenase [Bacteroidota bacterium]